MTLAAADWPNCPICHHPRYAHLQSVGVSAQRPASGGRQLGLPVRRDPVHLLHGHVRRGLAQLAVAGWVAGQFGEAAFDCAEGDAFAGLVGVAEDVPGDSFGVLLAHGAQCGASWPHRGQSAALAEANLFWW
jgi:hypothetical protein